MSIQKLKYCPECGTSSAVHVSGADKRGLFRCLVCNTEFVIELEGLRDGLSYVRDIMKDMAELGKKH